MDGRIVSASDLSSGDIVTVIRTDGSIDGGWRVVRHVDADDAPRVLLEKWSDRLGDFLLKCPRRETVDGWRDEIIAAQAKADS